VRAVLQDGVEVSAILTITFTERAAAEMRDRIRERLRQLGADETARATEGAFISTIHGFCSRLLRAHALRAEIDPSFSVLDESESQRLADAAFADAVGELAQSASAAVELIAGYGVLPLRSAILSTYAELRSRGELHPALPPLPEAPPVEEAREQLLRVAGDVAHELAALANPSPRVLQALERLDRCAEAVQAPDPWPGDLDALALPGGNGAAFSTSSCLAYGETLSRFREACGRRRAEGAHLLLDRLLREFGARYAERKREASGLDFEDLELLTRDLLACDADLRERYKARFERIMVDELQDTNAVQLALIESIAHDNLFTVGDAQQSIYAFRHADVELFERRGERLARLGARATLQTNFRSRREILDVINVVFAAATPVVGTEGRAEDREERCLAGERFTPLRAGRSDPPAEDTRVELVIADKGAEWEADGPASPWRLAEARALAARVAELVRQGAAPRDVVVLTRATTDLRTYERALEERGVPTYVIGGRGYWTHPQVLDLVSYLRALANPRDEEALYTVLASPLVGASVDALVILASAARGRERDPWWVLREPQGLLEDLGGDDRQRLTEFSTWFAQERERASCRSVEQLIDRALERTGYDLAVLAMPGGRRRLANVRKLMRLGREHERASGSDLRGFLELVRGRAQERAFGGAHESEAPVEGEALDAVRLMTIHRAKGLEFEIVCVADLGRGPRWQADLLRVGRDGRFGLRLAQPGSGKRESALDYKALGEQRLQAQAREERRLFYVAMTRARERLILTGAAKLDRVADANAGAPIAWIAPALVPDLEARLHERCGVADTGVRFTIVRPDDVDDSCDGVDRPCERAAPPPPPEAPLTPPQAPPAAPPAHRPAPPAHRPAPVSTLSYSSLGEYRRCGYRFYVERVLGLPRTEARAVPSRGAGALAAGLAATERGVLVHALLERLDFRRPARPTVALVVSACEQVGIAPVTEAQAQELAGLVECFAASDVCARLAHATQARREQRFGFLLRDGGVLITGALDVLARETGRMLVVDYKTDRVDGSALADIVAHEYATQRLIYALAVLRTGAEAVEVAHVFLERPDEPVIATFTRDDAPRLEAELAGLARGVLERDFAVTDTPYRALCEGCPAQGGLCSWPVEITWRETPDRLF
jgi:ATP-dependent helicase/nuclease subunit A